MINKAITGARLPCLHLLIEQGFAMGRPSVIELTMAVEGGALIRSSREDVGMRGEGSGPNPADWQGTVVLPTGPATLAALPRR